MEVFAGWKLAVATGAVCCALVLPTAAMAAFGIRPGSESIAATNRTGTPDLVAGSHPYAFTTTLALNVEAPDSLGETRPEGGNLKDIEVQVPPGLVGDVTAVPECSEILLETTVEESRTECPNNAAIGVITVHFADGEVFYAPVYNMVPPPGMPAEFGFNLLKYGLDHVVFSVRTGGDYGVDAYVENVSQVASAIASTVTVWGVPAEASHDAERGVCEGTMGPSGALCPAEAPLRALLRMPTSCAQAPLLSTLRIDSWSDPGAFTSEGFASEGLSGCGGIEFQPSISVEPETDVADTPAGLKVEVHNPQQGLDSLEGPGEADLKDATVTLPEGLVVNPASANGLAACSSAQIALSSPGSGDCPEASKIGAVEIDTPLLDHPLPGAVYLAAQGDNPFGSLLAIYIVVDDPMTGLVVKLAGHVEPNPVTGQLSTTVTDSPQLPFEDFKLDFFGGQRAALVTPETCGVKTTTTTFTPWSSPEGQDAQPSSFFEVVSGTGAAACGPRRFAPSLTAGTISNQAGAFSPFTLTLARQDGEQALSTVSARLPNGVAGMISKVELCGEAQADTGDCPASSMIGHVTVTAGVGGDPITLPEAGKPEDPIYITGPYKGAPFGVSIVVPAQAGPFDLGTVVVRGKVNVDPHTAQVSIESEPAPHILQGIPVDLRTINATIDRPEFMYNPTSCDPMSVTGVIGSFEGTLASVSSRFQAAGCAGLAFKPAFKVATHAHHTRRFGAYLHVSLTMPGSEQAHIRSVFTELPKLLPSRAETLKLACSEVQFAANPAGCPVDSHVGVAIVHTPVLPVPLTGPALLVSHGGAAFPDLEIVLQGDGVTLEQTGTVNIVKGITSVDFKSVPDAPISSIELTLPEGPHSALAATANLCSEIVTKQIKTKIHGQTVHRKRSVKKPRTITMPTTITGQNGDVLRQATKITVEGCAASKKKTKK
ncbi:MAG: hypothetical protein WB698_04640 [Solirubrobacteraceae bacterium]